MRDRISFAVLAATAAVIALAVGACGGGGAGATSSAGSGPRVSAPAAAPAAASGGSSAAAATCHRVPRTTVRLIASHANPRTQFNLRLGAAVHAQSGYAVSLVALAGGTQRIGTWLVDSLRAPRVVSSGDVDALRITNWPLQSVAAETDRQARICAVKRVRTPGPVAP